MKNLSLIFVALIGFSAHAEAPSAVISFKQLSDNIEAFEDLEHYHLSILVDSSQTQALLNSSEKCSRTGAFRKASAKAASKLLVNAVMEGISLGVEQELIDQNDGYYSLLESIDDSSKAVTQQLNKSKIEICRHEYSAAFSDGQIDTFVKINGEISFAVSVGFPD
jgi:hypothetical protein